MLITPENSPAMRALNAFDNGEVSRIKMLPYESRGIILSKTLQGLRAQEALLANPNSLFYVLESDEKNQPTGEVINLPRIAIGLVVFDARETLKNYDFADAAHRIFPSAARKPQETEVT